MGKPLILITGGSGLIGRHLTRDLAPDYEVVVLSRSPERVRDLPPGARAVGWDGKSADGWGALASGARAIVHLAGHSVAAGRWTASTKKAIRESRLRSSRAVLSAIEGAEEKPGVLLQGSAVGIYGDTGDRLVSEESPRGEGFLAEVAVEWEAVTAPVEVLGVRRVILRTGVVLARDGGALAKMSLPFRFFAGGPLGSGRQQVPWIHIADEVAAIRFLIEHDEAGGPFNLTAPHPVSNRELAMAIGATLRRPSLMPAPAFALRIALGEMADMLLEGQRAVPRRLQDLGFDFRFPTLDPALDNLLR